MIKTAGRHDDLATFFRMSGAFERTLPHTPWLAFLPVGDDILVKIVGSTDALLALDDDVQVMRQWSGLKRSDYFRMTVGDVRRAWEKREGRGT